MTTISPAELPQYPVRLVALRTGLTPHVLRAWERRYAVVAPARSTGGQRLYSELDVERLHRLRRLTERGHAIRRIAGLPLDALKRLEEELQEEEARSRAAGLVTSAPAVAAPPDESAQEFTATALRAAARFDAAELQSVLERAAVTLGVPIFLDDVVAPSLKRIGHGWAEGSVSIAQEHLATVVFRRVLGWLLGVYKVHGDAPRLVVATPPRQVHEMGALLVAVSAAAEGWKVTYLGQDLPVADLVTVAKKTAARAVAVSVVYPSGDPGLVAALLETRGGLPAGVPLLVGGAGAPEIRVQAEAAGAMVIDSLFDLRSLLHQLADQDVK